jgi:hypothetical protein
MDEGENLPQQDRQTTIISKESGYKRHAICDSRDALAIYLFVGARQQIVKSGPSLTAKKVEHCTPSLFALQSGAGATNLHADQVCSSDAGQRAISAQFMMCNPEHC